MPFILIKFNLILNYHKNILRLKKGKKNVNRGILTVSSNKNINDIYIFELQTCIYYEIENIIIT